MTKCSGSVDLPKLLLCVRLVRALAWPASSPEASAVAPRLDKASSPDSYAGLLRPALGVLVLALGVFRPIERMAVGDKPVSDIGAGRPNCAGRDRAPVPVSVNRRATHGPLDGPYQTGERRRRDAPTLVQLAVVVPTELVALWSVDTPEPDALAVDLDRIAVDHAGLPNYVVRTRWERGQNGNCQRKPQYSIYFDFRDDFPPFRNRRVVNFRAKQFPLLWTW